MLIVKVGEGPETRGIGPGTGGALSMTRHTGRERTRTMTDCIILGTRLDTSDRSTLPARRAVRRAAGLGSGSGVPIVIVRGDVPPTLDGERQHYETRGGTRVRHPSAYARIGWSNLVYCHSTRRVVVGQGWLRALATVGGAS